MELWKKAQRIIVEQLGADEPTLTKIDRYLTELTKVDPESVTFRYSGNTATEVYPIGVYFIDIANVKATMSAIIEYLDCTIFGIDAKIRNYCAQSRF